MGTRSAPMDDLSRHAQLAHGRPSAAHATPFGTMRADIKRAGLGLSASLQRQTQLRYLRIDDRDGANLRALRSHIIPHVERILDDFYGHLLSFPELRIFLTAPGRLERLRAAQRQYLDRLTMGSFDQPYFEERLAIGHAHQRHGIEPIWYIGAFQLLLYLLRPFVLQAAGADQQRFAELIESLTRALNLDIQLVVETYIAAKERSLQQANRELQQALEQLERTQEQLVRKEKLATLGQLAASVGHELRNPLGVIKNSAYYLKSQLDGAGASTVHHLQIIEREISRADKIIGDLLDFARIRPGARRAVDLNQLLQDHLQNRPWPPQVSRRHRLASPAPRVQADPDQLRQVLENLIQNAIQSMPEGGAIELTTTSSAAEARLAVADRGPGIPEQLMERIFEPLFTTRAKGTGLGLALSRALVEANGGRIEVQNRLHGGARFEIVLPLGG